MEQVINTFRGFLSNFGQVVEFINEPIPYLADFSIIQLFGVGIGSLLTILLGIHLIRLFIG